MKLLLKILGVLVGIIVLLLVIALFVRKDYTVQREIAVNKPRMQVFDYLKYQKNQDHYNKWAMKDPDMQKSYKGTDGTVGFSYAWDSHEMGKGEQTIKKIIDGERIDSEIQFIKPYKSIAQNHLLTDSVAPGQTKVTWIIEGSSKWPMNIMNLFIDKMLGKDMAQSLELLKGNLEK